MDLFVFPFPSRYEWKYKIFHSFRFQLNGLFVNRQHILSPNRKPITNKWMSISVLNESFCAFCAMQRISTKKKRSFVHLSSVAHILCNVKRRKSKTLSQRNITSALISSCHEGISDSLPFFLLLSSPLKC